MANVDDGMGREMSQQDRSGTHHIVLTNKGKQRQLFTFQVSSCRRLPLHPYYINLGFCRRVYWADDIRESRGIFECCERRYRHQWIPGTPSLPIYLRDAAEGFFCMKPFCRGPPPLCDAEVARCNVDPNKWRSRSEPTRFDFVIGLSTYHVYCFKRLKSVMFWGFCTTVYR